MAEPLAKGSRVTGAQRAELATELARRYADGESIRALADGTGRSFGFVHGLIRESGVPVRSRGGATRGTAAGSPAAAPSTPAAPAGPDKKPEAGKGDEGKKSKDVGKKSKKGKKR